jgi:hypothetical protein
MQLERLGPAVVLGVIVTLAVALSACADDANESSAGNSNADVPSSRR